MDTRQALHRFDLSLKRVEQDELLDLGWGAPEDAAQNLAEMQRMNEVFGGMRALTQHLYPRLLVHPGPATVLDLGTGGGGIPLAIARWGRKLNLHLRVMGIDLSARNLAAARRNVLRHGGRAAASTPITLLRADALALPFADEKVDFVISSLFMHHFSPALLAELLSRASRLARRALIMSDLTRGWLPYLGFKLIQPVFARSYMTRHDGALSIRRAYTPEELRRIAARAGLLNARIFLHFPWRMTLVVET